MSGRMDSVQPILPARDIAEAEAFYGNLGFARLGQDWGDYLMMRRDGVRLHFWKCDDRHIAENSSCYIHASDIDALHAELAASGIAEARIGAGEGPRMTAPQDRAWGMREFYIWDPSGNLLRVGEDVAPAVIEA